MAVRHIFYDKTELVLMFPEKKEYQTLNLSYDQIKTIQFDRHVERKLFRQVPSEKISIFTSRRSEPIVYTKSKEKQFFDEYKEQLSKFAKDNRITFVDNVDSVS